eukprot:Colp12_sorted_trinity150504_noHs@363
MSQSKPRCLFIVTTAVGGVSAQSFIQSFTLASSAFQVTLATAEGSAIEFAEATTDASAKRWITDVKSKGAFKPLPFQQVDAKNYDAIVIPSGEGCLHDLANNPILGEILTVFVDEKKPICAVGLGVAGLFPATDRDGWKLKGFCMTAPSLLEQARQPDFNKLPVITEDFIRDHLGKYSASVPDAIHVVVDRTLVTGQNEHSTLCAVQNLILLSNTRRKS